MNSTFIRKTYAAFARKLYKNTPLEMFQRIDTLKLFFLENVSISTGLQIYGGISILSSNFKGGNGKSTGALPMELPEASSGTGGTNITKSEVASRRAAPNGGWAGCRKPKILDNKDRSMILYLKCEKAVRI